MVVCFLEAERDRPVVFLVVADFLAAAGFLVAAAFFVVDDFLVVPDFFEAAAFEVAGCCAPVSAAPAVVLGFFAAVLRVVVALAAERFGVVVGFAFSSATVMFTLDVERVVTGILSPRQNLHRAQNSREPSRAEFHCGTRPPRNQTRPQGRLAPPGAGSIPQTTTTV